MSWIGSKNVAVILWLPASAFLPGYFKGYVWVKQMSVVLPRVLLHVSKKVLFFHELFVKNQYLLMDRNIFTTLHFFFATILNFCNLFPGIPPSDYITFQSKNCYPLLEASIRFRLTIYYSIIFFHINNSLYSQIKRLAISLCHSFLLVETFLWQKLNPFLCQTLYCTLNKFIFFKR